MDLWELLWTYCQQKPTARIPRYVRIASEAGYEVNEMYISRTFKEWRWSFKKASHEQLQKYTQSNISYYLQFVSSIQSIPWCKLKFLDESHFKSKDLLRDHVLGPINRPSVRPITNVSLDETFSVTLLTSLNPELEEPLALDIRENSNTADDFLNIVMYFLEAGYLTEGDYLIFDNASIHVADEIIEALLEVCNSRGVIPIRLPAYSPELNPCELVFSFMKKWLRSWRGEERFWIEILNSAAHISFENMVALYCHCLIPQ